jgi:serine palmitoyltransferase
MQFFPDLAQELTFRSSSRGRGVCDYFNIDPSEVDILMGTLTKSFGANGGYVAADKATIQTLRATNTAMHFGES